MWVAGIFSGAVLFLIWSMFYYRSHKKKKRLLELHIQNMLPEKTIFRSKGLLALAERFDQSAYGIQIGKKLEKVHLTVKPSDYCASILFIYVITGWIMNWFLDVPFFAGLLLAIGLMEVIKRIFFQKRKNKNMELFHRQLPDICRLLGNSLRAGLTVAQGIEMLAKELPNPAKQEFKSIQKELLLGVEVDQALQSLHTRMHSRDSELFTGVISIQRKTGGNLYAVLDHMAGTMEERFLMKQTIKTMTAEARYISFLLPLVPILLICMMNLMIEGFLSPLFTLPGFILLTVFLLVQICAFLLIKRITTHKV